MKSAYEEMKRGSRTNATVHEVWQLKVAPRIKVFGWLMYLNKILTVDNLRRRGWCIVNWCIMCKANLESTKHLFNECPFSKGVYSQVAHTTGTAIHTMLVPTEEVILHNHPRNTRSLMIITQFIIW